MERILNDEEKIRRAEEIYYRRNNQNINISGRKSTKTLKEKGNMRIKFFLNLLLMFNIAVIIFSIQNKDYIFTQEFIGKLNEYNINLGAKVTEFFSKILADETKKENNKDVNIVNENSETVSNLEENSQKIVANENSESSLNEMDLDVENLKNAYSFINPITGIVSSKFGSRESEYQKVTGYHTGVDVAAEEGTIIKASMEGIVELVSSEGDYGNHINIRSNNVSTLYAHCSKIFVKEGQIVGQGQEIGAVGNTGNSTGPHLHFEIRIDDRFVDPLKILTF
ncbi:MAG TPA: M23 family metallopeptidase [Candidatus Scatovivens faecipullorum]|nr:M23 family metallopeptidase [Candidatus Scatovivens faecipullorum]